MIGAIRGGPGIIFGGASNALTEATKRKLEALGVDTSNILTESEGQLRLQEALAKLAIAEAQNLQYKCAGNPNVSIEDKAKDLATSIGIETGNQDKIEFILRKISEALMGVMIAAGKDESKLNKYEDYKNQYDDICSQYAQATASENMTGATAMGYYNKMLFGL